MGCSSMHVGYKLIPYCVLSKMTELPACEIACGMQDKATERAGPQAVQISLHDFRRF